MREGCGRHRRISRHNNGQPGILLSSLVARRYMTSIAEGVTERIFAVVNRAERIFFVLKRPSMTKPAR